MREQDLELLTSQLAEPIYAPYREISPPDKSGGYLRPKSAKADWRGILLEQDSGGR